ncbi:DUF2339 domain-containing protein [Williamsia maris]|uniref:Membrane protein (DUF2339) n=1 Tax=Williamsia maris TaxID=72806 RepID=A0ABT1HDP0_9NOCA|nr:DUF2339 domain-containing protein [Williamsia maris]MCP2176367.1 putative membrane protein (DUF2339) [Williamsia maris]
MTESDARPDRPDWTVLSRVSADFESLSRQMAQMSSHLTEMQSTMTAAPPTSAPVPTPATAAPPAQQTPRAPHPTPQMYPPDLPQWMRPGSGLEAPMAQFPPPRHPAQGPPLQGPAPRSMPQSPMPPRPPMPQYPIGPPPPPRPGLLKRAASAADGRLVGAILAAAGVAVTLVGVVLLLVLAAQAGILRPEVRVGAGAVLAGLLVAAGWRMHHRAEGRIGSLALAATGIATAYLDVIAVTRIYEWLPAAAGLAIAAAVGGAGLALARRWDSEYLALGVLVPLIVLAPFVADGVNLTLVGFMLALSAVALPAHLGTDWLYLHVVRVVAGTIWLVPATALSGTATDIDMWLLAGACAVNAALTLGSTVAVLPRLTSRVATLAVAATSVIGVIPLLVCGIAVDRHLAAGAIALLALSLLALVLLAERIPSMTVVLRHTWAALAGVAALISVVAAFDAPVAVPALLGLAATITVVGRHDTVGRYVGLAFAVIGGLAFVAQSPVSTLIDPVDIRPTLAASTIVAGLLLAVTAGVTAWAWVRSEAVAPAAQWLWALTGVVALYAITTVSVTTGVATGGVDTGFFAGHMAATICWVIAAAAALVQATRVPAGSARIVPVGAGLVLAAAAVGKLMLFDLATLDGAFRVGAFIVVGLILLTIGSRYARVLGRDAAEKADTPSPAAR